DPVGLTADASSTFFAGAPVVVLAAPETALRAASVALTLGVPLLLSDGAAGTEQDAPDGAGTTEGASGDPTAVPETGPVGEELERLGTETVLTVGEVTVPDGAPEV